jgi:hypothetical protein
MAKTTTSHRAIVNSRQSTYRNFEQLDGTTCNALQIRGESNKNPTVMFSVL